jgi:D-glycero-alpha-D-manno-heptose-7-phosphate kinase
MEYGNMIISKAPVRITLGGGGTDLPSYYESYEGFVIAGSIDKYIFVGANKPFTKKISLKYSSYEFVDNIEEIKHNLIRESLKIYGIDDLEMTSLADIPSGTGLGSSGAFLVSLLNTLHIYKYGKIPSKREIAQLACKIELDILKEHEGKQDKYVSSFGGIKSYTFHKDGTVSIAPLINEDLIVSQLSKNLLLFYTGTKRDTKASDALRFQDKMIKEDKEYARLLHTIKAIGIKSKILLESLKFEEYGELLNKHWEIKKMYAPHSTNEQINSIYKKAKQLGALGGKTIGAPGGGFLLFYVPGPEKNIWNFTHEICKTGIKSVPYNFEFEGVQTLWNQ